MKVRIAIAIGWLMLAVPFGAVKAIQLFLFFAGDYDPVIQDGMRTEDVAGYQSWLVGTVVIAFVSSLIAIWYVRHTSKRAL
jgi:ABC-type phosphate transport system permease subunit